MAMIMRILIGWVLSYGIIVLFGMCYDKLMGAIDYVPWGFVAFLLAYNVIAFIASAVGLLRLKNPKHIAISYIVVTIGIFVSAIIKTAYFTAFNPLIFWCICNLATYAATMFCLVRLEVNATRVEDSDSLNNSTNSECKS
jgi:hypothetical protein